MQIQRTWGLSISSSSHLSWTDQLTEGPNLLLLLVYLSIPLYPLFTKSLEKTDLLRLNIKIVASFQSQSLSIYLAADSLTHTLWLRDSTRFDQIALNLARSVLISSDQRDYTSLLIVLIVYLLDPSFIVVGARKCLVVWLIVCGRAGGLDKTRRGKRSWENQSRSFRRWRLVTWNLCELKLRRLDSRELENRASFLTFCFNFQPHSRLAKNERKNEDGRKTHTHIDR